MAKEMIGSAEVRMWAAGIASSNQGKTRICRSCTILRRKDLSLGGRSETYQRHSCCCELPSRSEMFVGPRGPMQHSQEIILL